MAMFFKTFLRSAGCWHSTYKRKKTANHPLFLSSPSHQEISLVHGHVSSFLLEFPTGKEYEETNQHQKLQLPVV